MAIVMEMIEAGEDVPKDFKLYYTVRSTADRCGKTVKVQPHLTQKQAENEKGTNQTWEGKYGTTIEYFVADSDTNVMTENISNDCETQTEAIFKLRD
jgi:hypothetical protein